MVIFNKFNLIYNNVHQEKKTEDRLQKMMEALKHATQRIIIETKATNTYMVISNGKGGVKKIDAEDL